MSISTTTATFPDDACPTTWVVTMQIISSADEAEHRGVRLLPAW
ncbi:hypothetical protein ACXX9E_29465 [Pseudomonas sp. GNP014]